MTFVFEDEEETGSDEAEETDEETGDDE